MPDYSQLANTAKIVYKKLFDKKIPSSVKTSRYQTQIKAVQVSYKGSLEDLLKNIQITATVNDLSVNEEKAISGKYKAKLVVPLANGYSEIKEPFLIVNTFTEKGSIKTKDLAPDKLDLVTQTYTNLSSFDKSVFAGIDKLGNIPDDVKTYITELYKSVSSNTRDTDSIAMNELAKLYLNSIKPQDVQAIGKDFGEVLSLRWYVTQSFSKGWESFKFSTLSNAALVDYIVNLKINNKVLPVGVSAKFEKGAAPSINSIVDNIKDVYKNPNAQEAVALNVLKSLASNNGNTSSKILASYKTLKLPAYNELKNIIGKNDFTIEDISKKIQSIINNVENPKSRINVFKSTFEKFYKVLGKTASEDSLNVVFSGSTYKKYYSLVLSPMGYGLVDYMNKEKLYQDILNNISRKMKTEQVYLNFSGSTMQFKKKLFSKSTFKFAYGANAKDSDNTGIKFSMQ